MGLVLHAPNVHQGGGLALLTELIRVMPEKSFLVLDSRFSMSPESLKKFIVYYVEPSIWGRLQGEWRLKLTANKADHVLCLGNLPPLFPVKIMVTLFLQNRYLIDKKISLKDFSLKTRSKILIERVWFGWRRKNIKQFVVQSKSMQKIVRRVLGCEAKILPFLKHEPLGISKLTKQSEKDIDLVYVATGEPHKNHKKLVLAWVELAESGLFPSLCLTIDKNSHPSLCEWIEEISVKYKLKIMNMGFIPRVEVLSLYKRSKALIFPSLVESFGLPLVEANQFGVPIIASELDFVRDVVCPRETFDPHSTTSIARSVRRFLCETEPMIPLLAAEEFLDKVIKDAIK